LVCVPHLLRALTGEVQVHLARAAFRAIAFRFVSDNFLARAGPPFNPPLRRASVAGVSGPFLQDTEGRDLELLRRLP